MSGGMASGHGGPRLDKPSLLLASLPLTRLDIGLQEDLHQIRDTSEGGQSSGVSGKPGSGSARGGVGATLGAAPGRGDG